MSKPSSKTARPKLKTWRIRVDVTREVVVQAHTEAEARKLGAQRLVFHTGATEHVIDTSCMWLDKAGNSHLEGCRGNHCRHYACEAGDLVEDYDEWCVGCDA